MKRPLPYVWIVLSSFFLLSVCASSIHWHVATRVASPPKAPLLHLTNESRIVLMTVGDIMMHTQQLASGLDARMRTYRFDGFFSKVAPLFESADWIIGNLETTLAGGDRRYTGYPLFNSPASFATALKNAGFTAVTTANNHALDRRESGVLRTIENLERAGLAHTGTFRSESERNEPLLLNKHGMTLAVMAYTYGTNGIPIPRGKEYLINRIDPALIEKDIARARALGADIVVVSLHFGAEYQRRPNAEQRRVVDQCLSYGADLIIGHHPHVVQPYEWRTIRDNKIGEHKAFVIYSLGNFISAQRGNYKDVGAILKVTIRKPIHGRAVLESAELIPTYVHTFYKAGKRHYVVYPLPQTFQEKGEQDVISSDVYRKMETLYNETMAVFVTK